MSFHVDPAADACLVRQPPPALPPPGPPSVPRVCHRPAGHLGEHSTDREPRPLSVRWTGGEPNTVALINRQARAAGEVAYRDVLQVLDRNGVPSDQAMPLAQLASEIVRHTRLDMGESGLRRLPQGALT